MPRFGDKEHIRKREDFERTYETGSRIAGRLLTVFLRSNNRDFARLGIAATRKLGSAVVRNRAKRLVRELFRLNKPAPGLDMVVVPRREIVDASYSSIEAEFRGLVAKWERSRRGASLSVGPSGAGGDPGV